MMPILVILFLLSLFGLVMARRGLAPNPEISDIGRRWPYFWDWFWTILTGGLLLLALVGLLVLALG